MALAEDTLAERLRRRPAKPMGSPRVGSNPTGVDSCREHAIFGKKFGGRIVEHSDFSLQDTIRLCVPAQSQKLTAP